MDEQRAWIKMRRKRRLRVLAVVLCLSVLFVTYPNILETLSVFASENGSEENVLYVSGFCDLSDEIKEQTVPIGTGMEELALPDTLKAYMAQADEDSSVDIDKDADDREDEEADQGTEEQPGGEEADQGTEEQPDGEEADQGTEEQPDGEEADQGTEEQPDGEEADQGTEEQPGGEEASTEDQDASTEETDENVQETTEESSDTEQNTDTEKEEQEAQPEEIATADTDAEIRQETHTVALQEYRAENEITVNRLEDSSEENTETDIIENRQSDDADIVTITGITWQSDPAYDKETEDDYIFTAVLPEGYVLMEDVSMPQIVVTVKESENVRFFLERAEALPDLESMIEDAPGEDEKGYGEWETHFLESLSEAESLREMYDAFTETEQAQIPEDIYEKLAAWWEYADLMEEGTVYVSGTGWELNGSGVLTIESDAGMLDWRDNGRTTDNIGNVKQIVIKDGVTSIWESVFENCSGLTSVTMPDSVSGIGKRGFYGCRSLTSIEIPSSVTSIGESVFENCSNLTSITIPNGVERIGMMAFKSCSGLQNVTMSENLISISSSAFMYCSSLKEIEIPSTLKSISANTFNGCSSLTSIEIPSSVTSINSTAFKGCSSLTKIEIPSSVTSIGTYAFENCSSLTEIVISENVTSLETKVFNGCSSLSKIVIPENVTRIGEYAFGGCRSLTEIVIPENVTSLGRYAFYGCSSLTEVTIPQKVTSINQSVFAGCSGLTSINIPSGVTSIGYTAFKGCSKLTEITIPEAVTSIGGSAFYNCSSLTEVTIPENVASIESGAFSGCSGLIKVEMLSETPPATLGLNAFKNCNFVTANKKGILVPVGKVEDYKGTAGWSSYADYITDGTPQVTEQPTDQTAQNGKTATFSITAEGEGTLEYQWQVDKKKGTFENIANATSSTYAISNVTKTYDGYKYRCKVTNDKGTVTSDEAVLTVTDSDAEIVAAAKKVVQDTLADITATNETTKESIQNAIDTALANAGMTEVTVEVGDLTKTEATSSASGSIGGSISITSKNDGSVKDSVAISKTIAKLPLSEEEKVAAAKKVVQEALTGITATNDTTKESIQNVIDTALANAGMTEVTVEVGDLTKTEATSSASGSIGGSISITSKNDGSVKDSVAISKTIAKLPLSEEEKVAAAKKVVQEALTGITATNDTTKESIQNVIDTALANAGMTEVTVEVGGLTKTEATTGKAGSISGSISITSKNDSSVKASVAISKTIAKLPSSEEEKVEAAKAVVQEVLAGITATNETTKASIQNAIDTALAEAGIADVTVKVENLTKTEATTDKTGSISGSISITSKRDSSVKASVSINKTIPATGEEEPDKDKPSGSESGTSKPHRPKPTDTPQQTDTPNQTDTQRPTDTSLETPAQTQQTVPLVSGTANSLDGQSVTPQMQPPGIPGQGAGQENTAMVRQGDTDSAGTETEQPPTNGTVQTDTAQTDATQQSQGRTVSAAADDGRIVISGEPVATGNLTEELETSTKFEVGKGAVVVTVVCEDKYTAGVTDTVSMVNAVLAPEQVQFINDGENIEVRIDVKDISETVAGQDQEVIESGLTQYREQIPGLTIGMYADISMFIRMGQGDWEAVTSTKGPIEVVIGIPEEFRQHGREFYIIRSHEGEYSLLTDMDDDPETITISTDMFSAYAIAYVEAGKNGAGDGARCGLCHICPTYLGICCFVWLAIILLAVLTVVLVVLRRRKEGAGKTGIGI